VSFRWVLIGGSLFAHGGLVLALGALRAPPSIDATAIEVTETRKPEPPPPTEVDTPPPQDETPRRAPTVKPAAAPPPEAAPAATPLANLPDFGLELSGGTGGGGLAIPPPAGSVAARATRPVTKTLDKVPAPRKAVDTCDEGATKPKLVNLPQPAYTEAARAAGVEGKVRVQLTVDESGKVVDVQVLSALGHGLDEAAVAAARAASFEPGTRCGRRSRSTFTISIRFAAS
jgi:periplasmic protein TonB